MKYIISRVKCEKDPLYYKRRMYTLTSRILSSNVIDDNEMTLFFFHKKYCISLI